MLPSIINYSFYGELTWQYHAIDRPTLEKIQDALTTRKNQSKLWLAQTVQNPVLRIASVLTVIFMMAMR